MGPRCRPPQHRPERLAILGILMERGREIRTRLLASPERGAQHHAVSVRVSTERCENRRRASDIRIAFARLAPLPHAGQVFGLALDVTDIRHRGPSGLGAPSLRDPPHGARRSWLVARDTEGCLAACSKSRSRIRQPSAAPLATRMSSRPKRQTRRSCIRGTREYDTGIQVSGDRRACGRKVRAVSLTSL
jgi:hypothetical protein